MIWCFVAIITAKKITLKSYAHTWINLRIHAYSRPHHVVMVTNMWDPNMVGDFFTSQVTISFSRRTLLHGVR